MPENLIPCPLCGEPLEVKFGRRFGPYLWCTSCGMYLVAKKRESKEILCQMAGLTE